MILIADHFRESLCSIIITTVIPLNLVQFLIAVKYSEQEFSETVMDKKGPLDKGNSLVSQRLWPTFGIK
jgi:hypothetical protein